MTSNSALGSLLVPAELLIEILVNLDCCHIVRCRELSKYVKQLVDSDTKIQYIVELAIAGMVDGPPNALTTSDRLALLREHQQAWNTLSWRQLDIFKQRAEGIVCPFADGLFVEDGPGCLYLRQLPSVLRRIRSREWVLDISDVADLNVGDWDIDPSQDLILLLQHVRWTGNSFRCHARYLSTGITQPVLESSLYPTSDTPVDEDELDLPFHSMLPRKCGDYLAVFMDRDPDPSRIIVWNWKTGVKCIVLEGLMTSFSFVCPRYLMVFGICVYADADGVKTRPEIRTIDLDAVSTAKPISIVDNCLCAFSYPPFRDVYDTLSCELATAGFHGAARVDQPEAPFHSAREPQAQLHYITITLITEDGIRSIQSLIPATTFLTAIASLSPGETWRNFAWEEWGPDGSRMFVSPPLPVESSQTWSVHETLFARLDFVYPDTPDTEQMITVCDFNPLKVRRALCDAKRGRASDPSAGILATEPTRIPRGKGVFSKDVETSLPYLRRQTPPLSTSVQNAAFAGPYEAVMLSEDSLILMYKENQSEVFVNLTF